MKLHIQSDKGFTLIENKFIDEYMPSANGEYVKLYLYLLRCAGAGQDLTVSSIADFFDHTESDVRRALTYWEKLHLLSLTCDPDGTISDILLLPENRDHGRNRAEVSDSAKTNPPSLPDADASVFPGPNGEEAEVPSASSISLFQMKRAAQEQNIRQLIFIAEQYRKRPLTQAETKDIVWMSQVLHFSDDLTEYLMEYCASVENTGHREAERIALSWYRLGIQTVEEAKSTSRIRTKEYNRILRELGITNRTASSAECEFLDRWMIEYGFSSEMILEAGKRSLLNISQPNFGYMDTILTSWHEAGVQTMEDVARADEEHSRKVSAGRARKAASSAGGSLRRTAAADSSMRQASSADGPLTPAACADGSAEAAAAADVSSSGVRAGRGKNSSPRENQRSANQKRKNTFNRIPQHEYDWSDIEARIGSRMRAAAGRKGD